MHARVHLIGKEVMAGLGLGDGDPQKILITVYF